MTSDGPRALTHCGENGILARLCRSKPMEWMGCSARKRIEVQVSSFNQALGAERRVSEEQRNSGDIAMSFYMVHITVLFVVAECILAVRCTKGNFLDNFVYFNFCFPPRFNDAFENMFHHQTQGQWKTTSRCSHASPQPRPSRQVQGSNQLGGPGKLCSGSLHGMLCSFMLHWSPLYSYFVLPSLHMYHTIPMTHAIDLLSFCFASEALASLGNLKRSRFVTPFAFWHFAYIYPGIFWNGQLQLRMVLDQVLWRSMQEVFEGVRVAKCAPCQAKFIHSLARRGKSCDHCV